MAVFMSYCPQFWGSRVIYMFQSYDQKLVFFAFYGHFHELLPHNFGVPGRFTCLRVMTKKSSFSCFVDVFVSYCPQFWGSIAINTFETYEQNVVIFTFYGFFMSYCRFILGFQGDLHVSDLGPKTRLFLHFMDIFMSYCHSFGITGRFTCFGFLTKIMSFLRFMAIFMRYCPQFWGSRVIYMFQSYDQKLVFFAFDGHFHE